MNIIIKDIIIGPIVTRANGYVFDTWTTRDGLRRGYPYRRIEDAHYARKATIKAWSRDGAPGPVACRTIDEFIARSAACALPAAA